MKTFSEWMVERHPEELDEGFMKNLALAGALAAGAAGAAGWAGGDKTAAPERPTASQTQDQDDFDQDFDSEEAGMVAKEAKLRAAAQKVGIPRSQWGNLKGHMIGGVVTVVNGKRVPLTPKEAEHVKAMQELGRRMGN